MLVYVVLFLIFFSETGLVFMAFLPGDSLLFVAGSVAALPALSSRAFTFICWWSSLSRRGAGQHAQLLHRRRGLAKRSMTARSAGSIRRALMKTHAFFERHGGKTVMIARFVPVVRSFAPFVAGAPAWTFTSFSSST